MTAYFQKLTNSYFARFILSFVAVIIILLSVFLINDYYLKKATHQQLINNNQMTIEKLVENYESEWNKILHGTLSYIYQDEHFKALYNHEQFNFYHADQFSRKVLHTANIQISEYIDTAIIWFQNHNYLIDQTGVIHKDLKFSNVMVNEMYNIRFWEEQFNQGNILQFFPSGTFEGILANKTVRSKKLLPITIQNKLYPQVLAVIFIDVMKMHNSFQYYGEDFHGIFDENLTPLFTQINTELPSELPRDHYLKIQDSYLFYGEGEFSGLTYINQVPSILLSSTLKKLNYFSWSMLALSILLSIACSFLFSYKLYQPIQKLVRLAANSKKINPSGEKNPHELELISRNFIEMIHKNKDLARNIKEQSSLLEIFHFRDQLNNIRSGKESDLHIDPSPFCFILFKVSFKTEFKHQYEFDQKKAVYFYTNFIRYAMSQIHENQQTFQMESDIIVSIVFSNEITSEIESSLEEITKILEIDSLYSYFTIAIGPSHDHISKLTTGYEEAKHILSLRSPSEDTEMLVFGKTKPRETEIPVKALRELLNYLTATKFNEAKVSTANMLKQLNIKNAPQLQYQKLCTEIWNHMQNNLDFFQTDTPSLLELKNQQTTLKTLDEYHQFLVSLLTEAESQQAEKMNDHIVKYVHDYIKQNYAGEISLQIVAEHLNMSNSYLSAYIKEQTGMNFQDILNHTRIEKAKELLIETDLSMQDIATQIGYYSTNSFYRMFKKSSGTTPGEYKRKKRIEMNQITYENERSEARNEIDVDQKRKSYSG